MIAPRPARLTVQVLNGIPRPIRLYQFPVNFATATNSPSRYFSSTTYYSTNSNNSRTSPKLNSPTLQMIPTATEEGITRIDENINIEYPDDDQVPRTPVIQGRGSMHFKHTLAQFSLQDRVSVVTGGASGIGLALSQATVESGSHLAIVDMNRDEAHRQAETLLKQFKAENPGLEEMPTITAHYADVSDPTSVNDSIADIIAKQGKIDNLVTCAGFTENFSAVTYPHDRMQKLWGVVVDGTYLFATGVAKHLIERQAQGSMVLIGSMSGAIVNVPQPQAPYNAAKAAVRHLAASLAVEWAGHNIRVNCISPGYILTALTRKILEENADFREKWISLIPAGKVGTPEDLMGAVVFLLSDSAGYITGADLRVDGGYTLT